MRRALIISALVIIAAIGACRAFLPARFAVNAPVLGTLFGSKPPPQSELEKRLRVPAGFQVALFAEGIADARELKFTPTGDLLVSSPREGAVFLLERDANGDGRADGMRKLMTGLESPQGMEIIGEWLYVAENGAVKRVKFDPAARATQRRGRDGSPGPARGGNHWGSTSTKGPTAGST